MLNYKEAIAYILSIPKFTKKTNHDNIRYLMRKLGDPQEKLNIIHVAGTNGKGSVCAFTSNILKEAGYKTGLFTSPHLIKMNERIKINNIDIKNQEFTWAFNEMKTEIDRMIEEGYEHPSFFECLFAMALMIFDKEKVDYAILEVGLGGRLDATNMITNPKVTAITSIGLDHTEILGDTLVKISEEKAAIIKPGVPVVYYGENSEICKVIENKIINTNNKKNIGLKVSNKSIKILKKTDKDIDFYSLCGYYDKSIFTVPFVAEYQCVNAKIAISIVECLKLAISVDIVQRGIAGCKWEGRMEQVLPGVYFDGCHNEDGVREFLKTVGNMRCNGERYLIFSVVKEKDYRNMIKMISQNLNFSGIIITTVVNSRAVPVKKIKDCFDRYSNMQIYVRDDIKKAFELGLKLKKQEDILYCIGSLYLIGSLKQILRRDK